MAESRRLKKFRAGIATRKQQRLDQAYYLGTGRAAAVGRQMQGSPKGTTSPPSGSASYGRADKFTINHFSYPSDVDSDPMQGHYIMFNISTITPAILKAEKLKKDIATYTKQLQAEFKPEEVSTLESLSTGAAFRAGVEKKRIKNKIAKLVHEKFSDKIAKNAPKAGQLNRSVQMASLQTTRVETSIALYMPPSVTVNYGINYASDSEISSMAEVGTDVIKAFTQGGGDTLSKLTAGFRGATGSAASEGLQNVALKGLDLAAPGAKTLVELETGKVVTPRMELMFKGVGRRSFSFTFSFIPKSVEEAHEVENIIYTFKENMHPEYSNPTTRKEMRIPNRFEIYYMYQNKTNDFLNRISTCFLTTMAVQYGGDRFTAYESIPMAMGSGPPPQKSQITLGFTELETLSKAHIQEGF